MSGKQYLKDQLALILINLSGILALSLFLLASGSNIESILFIAIIWLAVFISCLMVSYVMRKKHLEKLLHMTEQLEERYLIPEIMEKPQRADEQVFYKIMKLAEKSMLEKIGEVRRERKEYKEYIEQWIHEVKTPITAMKLLCENNRSDFTRDMLVELENINRFTEQALYYARSEHTEKDYSIREIRLGDIVHGAIADNKYLLRQNHVSITVDDMENDIYADDKWVRFILNQIISNAVKYRTEQLTLHFFTTKKDDRILLFIEDNGIGIPQSDLPRIFEKGFTGQNGRTIQNSTGIGLYLCKRLCDKLGIGLAANSVGKGTTIVLSFHINDFVSGVQG
ncbi:sensor histidine kinase [Clostridium sp. AF19-22AC]|jgi:signal transduction histidine kinase|uniref:sensor histidine kinase n=1 Tax=Clostridia TaxID=186801 RepID=UPI000E4D8C20|nr:MULTISPECIES: sensor histidine kinase [Clostridia]RHR25601.1 sensor histidine kinase [Clostridium sp. AF19-22AC]